MYIWKKKDLKFEEVVENRSQGMKKEFSINDYTLSKFKKACSLYILKIDRNFTSGYGQSIKKYGLICRNLHQMTSFPQREKWSS